MALGKNIMCYWKLFFLWFSIFLWVEGFKRVNFLRLSFPRTSSPNAYAMSSVLGKLNMKFLSKSIFIFILLRFMKLFCIGFSKFFSKFSGAETFLRGLSTTSPSSILELGSMEGFISLGARAEAVDAVKFDSSSRHKFFSGIHLTAAAAAFLSYESRCPKRVQNLPGL